MEWITLKVFVFPQEACVAKSILESEGIETFLKDEMAVQMHNFYSQAIQGVKLQVPEIHAARALEILADAGYINAPEEMPAPASFVGIRYAGECPYCGSENVLAKRQAGYAWLLMMVFGFIAPVYTRVYHCYDCRMEWTISKK